MTELETLLIRHEGMRLRCYLCPSGKISIGVGRNLEDLGITEAEAFELLRNDIRRVEAEAKKGLPWFDELDWVRKNVILSMIFNLGMKRFLEFRQMFAAIQAKDYEKAASEMLNSKWASQVGKRAVELAEMMKSGAYSEE